jgi:hypothetical protein
LISRQNLSYITTRVFVQLLVIAKYDDRDIDGAEDGQLMRLLEQTAFALEESSVDVSKLIASRLARTTYTERFLSSLMALISIFRLPIAATRRSCGK